MGRGSLFASRFTERGGGVMPGFAVAFVLVLSLLLVSPAQAAAPVATIEPASEVGYASALAKGTVDPEGEFTTWHFEVVDQQQFEESEWASASWQGFGEGEGEDPLPAEATLSLSAGTTYHLRLVAFNEAGAVDAVAPTTFTTNDVAVPSVTIEDATNVDADSADVAGTVEVADEDPAFSAECRFVYATQAEWDANGGGFGPNASTAPCEPAVVSGADPQPVPVSATLEQLEPNTTYHLRLSAANAGGTGSADAAPFTTAAAAPIIFASTNTPEGAHASTVHAYVNPRNSALTECRFEWGPTAALGDTLPCDSLPAGGNVVLVSARIDGLDPGAVYNFQVVAESAAGVATSDLGAFASLAPPPPEGPCGNDTALGAPELPGCRAWEMVSHRDKNGGGVTLQTGTVIAAADGDSVAYDATGGVGAAASGRAGITAYRAGRGSNGWPVDALTPPQAVHPLGTAVGGAHWAYSDDLRRALLTAIGPVAPGAIPNLPNLYRQDLDQGTLTLLNPTAGSFPFNPIYSPFPGGASEDFEHVAFESTLNLIPGASGFARKAYEFTGGDLRLAGVLPDGSVPPAGSMVGAGNSTTAASPSAVSDDGSRIYFTSPPSTATGRLYLREDGSTSTWVSKSEATTPDPTPRPARFQDATPDGTRVFFLTRESLVDEDPDISEDESATDIYMYDVDAPEGEHLTLISADGGPEDGLGGVNALGVIGTSDDGSYVYFAAMGMLIPGQPPTNAGKVGIYLWHDGAVRLVATGAGDSIEEPNWTSLITFADRTARVAPDGRHLLFSSVAPQPGGYVNDAFRMLYLYDAEAESVSCVSCDPRDQPASGSAGFVRHNDGAFARPYESRVLAADGSAAYFHTGDGLLPGDANGRSDVYEWRGGVLRLLSGARQGADSYLGDASADGTDLFFITNARLSAADADDARDVYDARVGGGLPEPDLRLEACRDEACQGSPAASPPRLSPASAAIAAEPRRRGKPAKRCRKGLRKVSRNGAARCVKKKTKKHGRRTNR